MVICADTLCAQNRKNNTRRIVFISLDFVNLFHQFRTKRYSKTTSNYYRLTIPNISFKFFVSTILGKTCNAFVISERDKMLVEIRRENSFNDGRIFFVVDLFLVPYNGLLHEGKTISHNEFTTYTHPAVKIFGCHDRHKLTIHMMKKFFT